jgi:flagellar biosynthesis/type III secretory pathway chaperone
MTPTAVLAALLPLLEEEGAALAANDAERLTAIADRKEPLLRQLAAADRAALPRDLLARARALNERNGALLEARSAFTNARLAVLRPTPALVYGRDGLARG